jgi:hypothetical protein
VSGDRGMRSVKLVFALYAVFIAGGLVLWSIVGLTHS